MSKFLNNSNNYIKQAKLIFEKLKAFVQKHWQLSTAFAAMVLITMALIVYFANKQRREDFILKNEKDLSKLPVIGKKVGQKCMDIINSRQEAEVKNYADKVQQTYKDFNFVEVEAGNRSNNSSPTSSNYQGIA